MSQVPTVTVDGRTVTVSFELPFAVGDVCITPYHAERTTVSRIPDIGITLQNNLQRVHISNDGAWYSSSPCQMHGVEQYLPDMDAFLAYWLKRGDEHAFEDRIKWLTNLFADNPDAVAALQRRHIEAKQNAIQALTKEMTSTAQAHAEQIADLQSKLQKLKEST